MEETLNKILKKNGLIYLPINNSISFDKIYKLYIENIIYIPNIDIEYHYLGIYYKYICDDYDKAIHYLDVAAELGFIISKRSLGLIYITPGNYFKPEKALKYFKEALDQGCYQIHLSLGYFYRFIEVNYELMEYHYREAFKRGITNAYIELGNFYKSKGEINSMIECFTEDIEKNNSSYAMYELSLYYYNNKEYDLMEKYINMAIERNNSKAMFLYGNYYYDYYEYDMALKYYVMAALNGDVNAFEKAIKISFYTDNNSSYDCLLELILTNNDLDYELPYIFKKIRCYIQNNLELINNHFEYSLNGPGYVIAKKNFENQIKNI